MKVDKKDLHKAIDREQRGRKEDKRKDKKGKTKSRSTGKGRK
jgi:hypothetical protein